MAIALLSALLAAGALYAYSQKETNKDLTVKYFKPSGDVAQATNFTVYFSRKVVGRDQLRVPLQWAPVVFEPALPGKFEWIAADRLRFYPDVLLAPSTRYTAEISPDVTGTSGLTLVGNRQFTFQTPRFRVKSSSLTIRANPETNEQVKLLATVEFNYLVHPQEAAKYITIRTGDGGSVPFVLGTWTPSRIVKLVAKRVVRGEQEAKIQLRISRGLQCIGGNLGIDRDYVKPITLPGREPLKIRSALPEIESYTQGSIKLEFNLPVNAKRAGQYISIDPEVDFQLSSSHHYLTLRGPFSPGSTYQVTVRKGLRAVHGAPLEKDFTTAVSLEKADMPPQVDFAGDGYYLSRKGKLNLGIATINTDKVSVEIRKIFANNLAYLVNASRNFSEDYLYGYEQQALGKSIKEFDVSIETVRNSEVITPLNIEEHLADQRIGVFQVLARDSEDRWRYASRWVVATDMGLLAKKTGEDLWVWVNSLSSLEPVRGAELTLISRNNQTLSTARTNDEGIAVFKSYERLSEGFDPYLITATAGEDLSFLLLGTGPLSTSDFNVGGATYLKHGYEAFVYNERGIYRPGETAHLAAVMRGQNTSVPPAFPIRFKVLGPDGKVLLEQKATFNEQGAVEFSVPVPEYAKTGTYTAMILIGEKNEIGRTIFSVEDFMPDRIKVKVATDKDSYAVGEAMRVEVDGMTLFGPPAAGYRVQGDVVLEPLRFSPPDYKTFTFVDAKKSFSTVRTEFDEDQLDENGKHTFEYSVPEDIQPPSALQAMVSATVLEPGGRGVSDLRKITVHPYETYVGLRKPDEGFAKPNQEVPIEFVVTDQTGAPISDREVEVTFFRIYWHSILKYFEDSGRFRYQSEQVEEPVQTLVVRSADGIGRFRVRPNDYGSFRVVARDTTSKATASVRFYASGWGYAPWAMETPERLDLDPDKDLYQVGDTATVQVRTPFSGKLLVTIEREGIFDHKIYTIEENTATIEIPIVDRYKPNVYVSAHLIRSTDSLERNTPVRAFGVVPLQVNTEAHKLSVELTAPQEMRPKNSLTVDFQVKGRLQGSAYLTIAAVDEGILQLTDFLTPDAHGHFFGKKRLSVESYDVYSHILPEIGSSLSSPSGDGEPPRKRYLKPGSVKRTKPVAFWSGLVKTDEEGRGSVHFDVPMFNGTLRLMAVAYADDLFGKAEKPVLVRDAIVLTPTLPRFIGSGDEFVVPVSVFNGTGQETSITVSLAAEGPVAIVGDGVQSLTVPDKQEKQVRFRVKAEETTGKVSFKVHAEGGGEQTEITTDVPLRSPVSYVTLTGNGSLEEGKPAVFTLPADWIPGTTKFAVNVSGLPTVQFARSLQYLLRYPYGCIEQTTSRVFPLLYFNDVARVAEPQLFNRTGVEYFIEEGISRIESMQLASGSFAFWPGENHVSDWGSIYAAHFLVEARKAGFQVADRVYDGMLNALRRYSREFSGDRSYSYEQAAYACYVLSLAGKPEKSTMHYLKDSALKKLRDYSRFQLAGAFALAGDRDNALRLLPKTVVPLSPDEKRESGGNFNSSVRARAIMLAVLAEVDEHHPLVPVLVEDLTRVAAKRGRWSTTQENAFAFLALGKILRKQGQPDYTGKILVDGQVIGGFDSGNFSYIDENWGGKEVTLSIQGSGTCYYYWRADGLPSTLRIDEYDRDLSVRRRYLDKNGDPVDYDTEIHQGDLLIAEITVKPDPESISNVAVVDLLPAGFEIENPRLQSRRGIDWISDDAYRPEYMDIRDDRMIIFGNFSHEKSSTFYYGVRAVTEGSFVLPPVLGEAMYAPVKASVASSGRIVVQGPKGMEPKEPPAKDKGGKQSAGTRVEVDPVRPADTGAAPEGGTTPPAAPTARSDSPQAGSPSPDGA